MYKKYQMKMKNDTWIFLSLWFSILLLGAIYFIDRSTPPNIDKVDTVTVTDTIYRHDTLSIEKPVPKIVEKVKIDTVYDHNGNEIPLITETKQYRDTLFQDKDTAVVSAQVTGIEASLDTLSVIFNRREVTKIVEITNYIEKKKTFKDRFHIQPQAGVGYAIFNKKVDVYLGIGIGVDL